MACAAKTAALVLVPAALPIIARSDSVLDDDAMTVQMQVLGSGGFVGHSPKKGSLGPSKGGITNGRALMQEAEQVGKDGNTLQDVAAGMFSQEDQDIKTEGAGESNDDDPNSGGSKADAAEGYDRCRRHCKSVYSTENGQKSTWTNKDRGITYFRTHCTANNDVKWVEDESGLSNADFCKKSCTTLSVQKCSQQKAKGPKQKAKESKCRLQPCTMKKEESGCSVM
eukprot:CAMPEP_0115248876 /NCGR_PEP_ID=MMETSP0270-20121206/42295_1 /TAXON_ID=71861 /ORGANISM="Scrippsiella trochoidea, Strain CCMP3099" /LENGTH=224 /DNA_ID=CAMNT_0002664189 /DNA_START=62 /DNA_END=736 /DNA_ORIENTATION=+